MSLLDSRNGRNYSVFYRVTAYLLLMIAVLSQVYVAWRYWNQTWDDSAITLGFARTFAATGRIEPTPGSGIVEGYSTTLWMLIMAAVSKVVPDPSNLLAAAKLGTLVLNIANLFLIRAWLSPWLTRTLGALAAGLFGCSFMFFETINGMETPLLVTLLFALLLLQRSATKRATFAYLVCGIALGLTRWEAAWFLIPIVLSDPLRKRSLLAGASWLAALVITNAVRWMYFASLLPNTIIAKHGAPYISSDRNERLIDHLKIFVEIKNTFWWLALIIILYFFLSGFSSKRFFQIVRNTPDYLRSLSILGFCTFLSVAIGHNWGPDLRPFYPGFPFLIAVILFPLAQQVTMESRSRAVAVTVGLMSLVSLVHMSSSLEEMSKGFGPPYMPGATVAHVREISDALAKFQEVSGRTDLLYAGPDMGAVLLYSRGIRVIDLGLLCNRHLASARYHDIQSYLLDEQRPDIIEIHGIWTGLTGLGRNPKFYLDYRPLRVAGKRFFVRQDLLSAIPGNDLTEVSIPKAKLVALPDGAVSLPPTEDTAIDDTFAHYSVLR